VACEKPEPRPITESITAEASTAREKVSHLAIPPNNTGFSATW